MNTLERNLERDRVRFFEQERQRTENGKIMNQIRAERLSVCEEADDEVADRIKRRHERNMRVPNVKMLPIAEFKHCEKANMGRPFINGQVVEAKGERGFVFDVTDHNIYFIPKKNGGRKSKKNRRSFRR
jgi:hypothetical protein